MKSLALILSVAVLLGAALTLETRESSQVGYSTLTTSVLTNWAERLKRYANKIETLSKPKDCKKGANLRLKKASAVGVGGSTCPLADYAVGTQWSDISIHDPAVDAGLSRSLIKAQPDYEPDVKGTIAAWSKLADATTSALALTDSKICMYSINQKSYTHLFIYGTSHTLGLGAFQRAFTTLRRVFPDLDINTSNNITRVYEEALNAFATTRALMEQPDSDRSKARCLELHQSHPTEAATA